MGGFVPGSLTDAELRHQLLHRIEQRSGGRIRGVDISVRGGKVVLSGRVNSYYFLSLALAAVRETVNPTDLELQVEVDGVKMPGRK